MRLQRRRLPSRISALVTRGDEISGFDMPLQPQMFILVLFHDKGDCVCLSHDAVPSPAGKVN